MTEKYPRYERYLLDKTDIISLENMIYTINCLNSMFVITNPL